MNHEQCLCSWDEEGGWVEDVHPDCQIHFIGPGGVVNRVHDPSACEGHACCYHSPSDHPLADRPLNIRFDRPAYNFLTRKPVGYLTERICKHGVGHPDPDSLAWLISQGCHTAEGIHGCDGCCWAAAPESLTEDHDGIQETLL